MFRNGPKKKHKNSTMANQSIDIREPLRICLGKFRGASGTTRKAREASLLEPFSLLARKMIYGGYFKVRNQYAIFIHTVEFYYHEETGRKDVKVEDQIVYHRNGRYLKQNPDGSFKPVEVPYFPLMKLHSHWSGFDITFESAGAQYRASALIREYAVYDFKAKAFVKLDTTQKGLKPVPEAEKEYFVGVFSWQEMPYIDTRSSYLQYYLNGFPLCDIDSDIEWIDFSPVPDGEVMMPAKGRQNADDHPWAYAGKSSKEHISQLVLSDYFQKH